MATKRTSGRVIPYANFLLGWMQERKLATCGEVEKAIFTEFEAGLSKEDFASIDKTGTQKWRNDCHWARARLTQNGLTITVGDWFILLPDCRGNWEGQALSLRGDAAEIIRKVAERLPNVKAP